MIGHGGLLRALLAKRARQLNHYYKTKCPLGYSIFIFMVIMLKRY